MIVYTLTTSEYIGYSTTRWFIATSKLQAIKLTAELKEKSDRSTEVIQRVEALLKRIYDNLEAAKEPLRDRLHSINTEITNEVRLRGKTHKFDELRIEQRSLQNKVRNMDKSDKANRRRKILMEYCSEYYAYADSGITGCTIDDLIKQITKTKLNALLPSTGVCGD